MNTQINAVKPDMNFDRSIRYYSEMMKTLPCSKDAQILIQYKISEMRDYAQYGID